MTLFSQEQESVPDQSDQINIDLPSVSCGENLTNETENDTTLNNVEYNDPIQGSTDIEKADNHSQKIFMIPPETKFEITTDDAITYQLDDVFCNPHLTAAEQSLFSNEYSYSHIPSKNHRSYDRRLSSKSHLSVESNNSERRPSYQSYLSVDNYSDQRRHSNHSQLSVDSHHTDRRPSSQSQLSVDSRYHDRRPSGQSQLSVDSHYQDRRPSSQSQLFVEGQYNSRRPSSQSHLSIDDQYDDRRPSSQMSVDSYCAEDRRPSTHSYLSVDSQNFDRRPSAQSYLSVDSYYNDRRPSSQSQLSVPDGNNLEERRHSAHSRVAGGSQNLDRRPSSKNSFRKNSYDSLQQSSSLDSDERQELLVEDLENRGRSLSPNVNRDSRKGRRSPASSCSSISSRRTPVVV